MRPRTFAAGEIEVGDVISTPPPRGSITALGYSAAATLARLRELVPRGRFTRQGDGMPVLIARSKALAGCHVYEQHPGRLLGLFYTGSPRRWLYRLGDLVVRHLAADGEGILHVRWCPEAAERLRAFSRGRPRGAAYPVRMLPDPAVGVENGHAGDDRGRGSPAPGGRA